MARVKKRPATTARKGVAYLLPSLMTAGNLFCGFMAVLQIIQGSLLQASDDSAWIQHYQTSLLWILGAFIFDMLDGRVARLGGHESAFGREFDSLADVISFGIAAPQACPACWNFKLSRGALGDISTDSRTACSFMFSRIAMNSISGVINPLRA